MAKGGLLGKLLTAAACGAAIGGACYMFRDKIKESKIYEDLKIDDKLMTLRDLFAKDVKDEEDYFDEDEYIFETDDTATESDDNASRSYVSLNTMDTIPEDDETDSGNEEAVPEPETSDNTTDDSVPTISLHTEAPNDDKGETPSGYDMEGLSDVSEDPDILMEMTKLDAEPSDL